MSILSFILSSSAQKIHTISGIFIITTCSPEYNHHLYSLPCLKYNEHQNVVILCRKITLSLSKLFHFIAAMSIVSYISYLLYKNIAHRMVILCEIRQKSYKKPDLYKKSPSRQNLTERARAVQFFRIRSTYPYRIPSAAECPCTVPDSEGTREHRVHQSESVHGCQILRRLP